MIQVLAPDGSIVEFPDGTPPAEQERAMRQAFGGPAPAAQPQAEPSLVDRIMSTAGAVAAPVGQFARGARRGVANVLGLPVDIVNNAPRLANLIPGVDGVGPISRDPFLGSDSIDRALGGFGVVPEPPAPANIGERVLRRVGEEVGAAAVPVGAALGTAARVGIEGAREMRPLARALVEPAAVNPGRYVAKEATVAAGAGQGAAIANELVDRNTTGGQVADMAGALTGAGVVGVGSVVGRGAGQVFNAVRQNPQYIDQVVNDTVTERLLDAAGYRGAAPDAQPLIDTIMSSRRPTPASLIPGYQETLADRTGNAGIAAFEYSRQQGPNAGQFIEQRSANSNAVAAAMRGLEPQETPGVFRSALDAERQRRLDQTAALTRGAQAEAADAAAAITPTMTDATARGSSARTALQGAKDVVRAQVDEAYRPVNEATVPVDVAPLAERFATTQGEMPLNDRMRFLPSEADVPRRFVEPAAPPTESAILGPDGRPFVNPGVPASGEVPLREVAAIRSGLAQDIRTAQNAQEGQRARVAGRFQTDVNQFLDEAMPPELRAQYEAANAARRDMADRFERPGAALTDILARQEGGGYAMDPSAVTPRLTPTNQGAVTDFRAAIREAGSDPRLREALADEIVVQAQRAGGLERPDVLRRFLADRSIVLDEFPELRQRLDTAANTTERAATAQTFQRDVERDLGTDSTPGRGTVGKYLRFSDAQAERAISEVLNAADPGRAADDLIRFVGDNPRAVEGARAAFWRKLKAESTSADNTQRSMDGNRQWRGDWLKSWLDDPRTAAVADRLYRDNPDDLQLLRTYADVLDNADLRTRARAPATSGTGQGISNILTPETLQSRTYAYMRGQVHGTYLATSIAAVVARRAVRLAQTRAIDRLTDEVLLDPQKAVALLRENNPANRAALARRARAWLGNEASTFVNLMNEEDDDTKNAVMRNGQ